MIESAKTQFTKQTILALMELITLQMAPWIPQVVNLATKVTTAPTEEQLLALHSAHQDIIASITHHS